MNAFTPRPFATAYRAAITVAAALAFLSAPACKTTAADGPTPPASKPDAPSVKLPPAPPVVNAQPFDPKAPTSATLIAVAGADSIKAVGSAAQLVFGAANPNSDDAMDPESLILEAMEEAFGFSDTSWVNLDAPIYLAMTRGGDGSSPLLMLPVSNYAAALASLPKTQGIDVGNHVHAYRQNSQMVYIDTVGRHLVISAHNTEFAAVKASLGRVITWNPAGVMTGYVAPKALASLAGVDIDELLKNLPQLLELDDFAKDLVDPAALVAFARNLVNDIGMVRLSATNPTVNNKPHIGMEFGLLPVPGSGLAKFMQVMAQAKIPAPTMMPPQTWFGALANLDLRAASSWVALEKSMVETTAKQLGAIAGAKAAAKYIADSQKISKAITGKSMMALYADQGFPMAALSFQPIEMDSKTFRKLYNDTLESTMKVLWADVASTFEEVGLKDWAKMKVFNTKKFIKQVNKGLKEVAMRLKKVKGKDHDAFVFELTKPKGKAAKDNDVAELHQIVKSMGGRLEFAIAYGPKALAAGFGPSGISSAQALASGRGMGGSPIVQNRSLNTSMLGFLNIGELIAAIKGIPMIGAMMPVPDVPKSQAMLMGMRSDGSEATLSYVMPLEYIAVLGSIM